MNSIFVYSIKEPHEITDAISIMEEIDWGQYSDTLSRAQENAEELEKENSDTFFIYKISVEEERGPRRETR